MSRALNIALAYLVQNGTMAVNITALFLSQCRL
jgi:hypothetical protein